MKMLIVSNAKERTTHYYNKITVAIYHHAVESRITIQDLGRYKIISLKTGKSQGVLEFNVIDYDDERLKEFRDRMKHIGLDVYMELM